MKVLNNNCRNDISDQECYRCSINGHITECPEKCEQFEPVISQELMDHYKALGEHYTSGERDGSCGSYICKHYSNWESEE